MNYTFNQLKVFTKIVQHKSITKAAEELFLSQPAVSIQLKNFQDQFDYPLVEIINKRLYVTEFGFEIAKAAENILYELELLDSKTAYKKDKLKGKFKIASVSTGQYVIPSFLSEFLATNNEIEVELGISNKMIVLDALSANEVDFAIVSNIPKNLKVNHLRLASNYLYWVCNSSVEIKENSLDFIKKAPLIFREHGSSTRLRMEHFLKENKINDFCKIEVTANEGVKQSVISNIGISLLPLIGIRSELDNKVLQIIPVEGTPIQTEWYIVWHPIKKLSPVAEAFLSFLDEKSAEIEKANFSWITNYLK